MTNESMQQQWAELIQCLLFEGYTAEEAERVATGMFRKYPDKVAESIASMKAFRRRHTN